MNTFKNYFFIILLGIVSANSISMEKSTRAILSHKENIFKDLQNDLEKGNFIFFDALVFTNKTIGNALLNAEENNNANIEGTIGTHWCNKTMKVFFDKNDIEVDTIKNNHLKRFLISEKDPRLGSPGKCAIYEGSANPTNYAYNNKEILVQTKNDRKFFMDHFNHHNNIVNDDSICSLSEKEVLQLTPRKRNTAFGSNEIILSLSKEKRVQSLIESQNKRRILYITSMNWNSPEMTQALIDAQEDGVIIRVILNHSALKGKGKEQLTEMHNAGVPIFIYNPGKNNRTIQHSKVMLRIDGTEHLLINSSANMTPEGDKEHNSDSYYPNNKKMVTEVRLELKKFIAEECKSYKKATTSAAKKSTYKKKTKK